MWSQALPKWISRSSRDREWVLNGESEDGESEDGESEDDESEDGESEDDESEDGGFADGDCRLLG